MRSTLLAWTAALGLVWAAPAALYAGQEKKPAKDLTPAEAARKALNQKVTIDYLGQSLHEVINHLREKTKVNFVFDSNSPFGFGMPGGPGIGPGGGPGGGPQIHFKTTDGKLGKTLRSFLARYNLAYVILSDRVLITNEQLATMRQLQQRVTLDLEKVPLREALNKLRRETGANLVIDPSVADKAKGPVTLELDDTPLEAGVRLLAEMAGLKAVPLGNVLFVTTDEKATKIRRENDGSPHNPGGPRYSYPPPVRFDMPAAGGFGGRGVAAPGRAVKIAPPK
jgi:type II secretory pathway component GspD/PulD (secretin)